MIDLTPSIPYIIGASLGALTTFLGYSLNEYSKRKDKNEKRIAARKMIKYEIDHDIKLLEQFYSEIKNTAKDNGRSLGYNMGNSSFPPLDKTVFNKYSFLLSSKENEFENIYNFYRIMGDLQIIHSKTAKISNRSNSPLTMRYANGKTVQYGIVGEKTYFNKFTELWNEFESLMCNLINEGNPLVFKKKLMK